MISKNILTVPANVIFGHSKNFKDFQEYKLIGEDFLSELKIVHDFNETSMSLRISTAGLLFSAFLPG